jgi:hypothetical protein
MSISELDRIDLIGTRPDGNIVKLAVADNLPWNDVGAHSRLLQDKINAYIAFVESGQLKETRHPPIPANPVVRIVLAAQYTPPPEARPFLARLEQALDELGIGFDIDASFGS